MAYSEVFLGKSVHYQPNEGVNIVWAEPKKFKFATPDPLQILKQKQTYFFYYDYHLKGCIRK